MEQKKELVQLFLEQNSIPKYVFGRNQYTEEILNFTKVKGVIDEFATEDSYKGTPIIHNVNDIELDAIIVNAIYGVSPVSVQQKLEKAGFKVVDIFSFYKYSEKTFNISFWEGFKESYNQNRDSYDNIYKLLVDDTSKKIFQRLLNLRLDLDFNSLLTFKTDGINQYFEDFLNLQEEGESFVDVGGFDGNTTLQFIKRCPRYDKIYFFEPEPDIMAKAKKNLIDNNNIEYCQFAASNKKEILHFSSNNSASKVTDSGEIEIHAEKIDTLVHSKVTFIKMDIEGSESLAIEGARDTILKYHPRLAICVYHKGGDYIDIPRQVFSIRNDYDIYMRHYTEGVTETVMFFMPKK